MECLPFSPLPFFTAVSSSPLVAVAFIPAPLDSYTDHSMLPSFPNRPGFTTCPTHKSSCHPTVSTRPPLTTGTEDIDSNDKTPDFRSVSSHRAIGPVHGFLLINTELQATRRR
jgi:hypothetical protein